jgi:glycosyltransferase involved in cell wall biosynthesis
MARVVMFVYNDCTSDQRVLREAETLTSVGHRVTIIARAAAPGSRVPMREVRAGVEIVRIAPPSSWRAKWLMIRYPWRAGRNRLGILARAIRAHQLRLADGSAVALLAILAAWSVVRLPFYVIERRRRRSGSSTLDWLVSWRLAIIGWANEAARAAPPADVWHGHDLTGLPGAVEGRRLQGGRLVYDSHELFVESGSNARRPAWAKWLLRRLERSLSRRADALVTVNQTLADKLDREYGFRRVVVLHNTPNRWDPPTLPDDRLRAAAGIEPGTPVALYHGGFSGDRGLVPLAEAMLSAGLEGCHLVYLGMGDLRDRLVELAAEPRFGGRIHVLDAVPPDELLAWVASADVGVMPNQPTTANERLSTPNKLFESLAAGIPVVTSDFPERRRIILDDPDGPLGAVCDPTDPASIGAAIRSIVSLDPVATADLRRRCLAAAHERWNWETESRRLVDLYAELTGG